MRRKAKVDSNQPQIVDLFRRLGYSVLHLHAVGQGCPDILVGKDGYNYLIEIKDGNKPPSARKLTPDEAEFHDSWNGHCAIIETIDDVMNFNKAAYYSFMCK